MERMKPKKLNVADIRNIIRLEENEINGPTYKDYQTEINNHYVVTKCFQKDLVIRPIIDITS